MRIRRRSKTLDGLVYRRLLFGKAEIDGRSERDEDYDGWLIFFSFAFTCAFRLPLFPTTHHLMLGQGVESTWWISMAGGLSENEDKLKTQKVGLTVPSISLII